MVHGVDCDGESRVVPFHLILLIARHATRGATAVVVSGVLGSVDANDTQDDHHEEEADADDHYHHDPRACAKM